MLEFTRAAYDEAVYHAYEGGSEEVCGVLAGDHGEERSVVTDVRRAENAAETPEIRYLIDPEEQFEIIEAIEAEGLAVAGFYHSHPTGPAAPSETDADRAAWPGLSYAICALDGYPYLGSWRWRDGAFEQETVRIRGGR